MSPNSEHQFVCIMAGGAGTRLWPKSRSAKPKQFQKFVDDQTPFEHMVALATTVVPLERIIVQTVADFAGLVHEQAPDLPIENIIIEPERRDNGPAMLLGIAYCERRDSEAVVATLWSDHLIREGAVFTRMLRASFAAAEKNPMHLVTVGAKPTEADPNLGYIKMAREVDELEGLPIFVVQEFIEKPDLATAKRFVSSWEYLWNVGYKVMKASSFFTLLHTVQPEYKKAVEALRDAVREQIGLSKAYGDLPKLSIEHLFTAHIKDILVIPADMGWSDIGTWKSLYGVLKNGEPLVTEGQVVNFESKDSLVLSENNRPVIVAGIRDMIIVDAPDALFIMHQDADSKMKEIVAEIKKNYEELL